MDNHFSPRPIRYLETELGNKTTPKSWTVFQSPFGVPDSHASFYMNNARGMLC